LKQKVKNQFSLFKRKGSENLSPNILPADQQTKDSSDSAWAQIPQEKALDMQGLQKLKVVAI